MVALGNAMGSDAPLTREVGTVTGFGRTVQAEDTLTGISDELTGLIEFAAPVRAGDSGGPVVNGGQVVGITTAASVNFRWGREARATRSHQRRDGRCRPDPGRHPVRHGPHRPPVLLGVGVRTTPRDEAGVLIQDVLRGGPAELAGLKPGDILVVLDGVPPNSTNTLTSVLDRHYVGDVLDLTWVDSTGVTRDGKAVLTPTA